MVNNSHRKSLFYSRGFWIKSLLKLLFNTIKRDTSKKHEKSASHQVKSKNKWLYPEDNFGVLERGKAWSEDYCMRNSKPKQSGA